MSLALLAPAMSPAKSQAAEEPVVVTVKTFARAESDRYFGNVVKLGGFGKFYHYRLPTPVEKQNVVRMNRDTLYSAAVFDLNAGPVAITVPDPGSRFMSIQTITEDHYSPPTAYAPTTVTMSRETTGTRYAIIAVRTFANANNEADLRAANSLQDQIRVEQPGGPGTFDVPNWDPVSLGEIRSGLANLQSMGGCTDSVRMGLPDEVDPVCHLLATATGWGLNPPRDAAYVGRYPDSDTELIKLTVKDVPVDGFWSITVYNRKGFLVKNDLDSYSINNVTATPSADGSYTIQFGGCTQDTVNCLVTPPDWNYTVRMYRPREAILDGSWAFPQANGSGR
jgi:hypothetical protein